MHPRHLRRPSRCQHPLFANFGPTNLIIPLHPCGIGPHKLTMGARAALLLALSGALLPYASPYSLVPGICSPHRAAAAARGAGRRPGLRVASPPPRRLIRWGGRAAGAYRESVELRMVNAELLESIDEIALKKMKVAELKEICEACGLTKTGKKADLIERILELQAVTAAPGFPAAEGEDGDDEGELGFEGFEFEPAEPQEVYGIGNPAPARMFDASGNALAREELPELGVGANRFVAQPRTGNCWHGLYFDIHAKDKPITVTAIRTASSPEGSAPIREDKMNMFVYSCDGSTVGQELVQEVWTQCGEEMGIQLPVVGYGDSEPFYGSVPLDKPLEIKAGGTVGVCLFTSSWRGVVLRAKLGEATGWQPGDLTDEDEHISLHAGILPRNDDGYQDTMFTKVRSCSTPLPLLVLLCLR